MSTIAAEDFYRAISPLVLRRGLPSPGAPKGSPVPARIGAAIHGTKLEKSTFAGVDILAYSCTIVVGCSGPLRVEGGTVPPQIATRSPPAMDVRSRTICPDVGHADGIDDVVDTRCRTPDLGPRCYGTGAHIPTTFKAAGTGRAKQHRGAGPVADTPVAPSRLTLALPVSCGQEKVRARRPRVGAVA